MVFGADRDFLRKLAADEDSKIRRLVFPGKSDVRTSRLTSAIAASQSPSFSLTSTV